MEIDELLRNYVGVFGRYQKLYCVFSCLVGLSTAFSIIDIIFVAYVQDYWCSPKGSWSGSKELTSLERANLTVPYVYKNGKGKLSPCSQYSWYTDTNGTLHVDRNTTQTCTDWDYDRTVLHSTAVSQYDLVCEREWLVPTAQSITMAGMLVGVLLSGFGSDRFGRRPAFIVSSFMNAIARILFAFSPNYTVFLILRFFIGATVISASTVCFILGMELVGAQSRVMVGTILIEAWSVACCFIPLVAYFLRDWDVFTLVGTIATLPLCLSPWLCPESPRWLYTRGRREEADDMIRRMAAINKTSLPEKLNIQVKADGEKPNILEFLKSRPLVIRTLVMCLVWISTVMVYYGLLYNVGNLAGDIYLNALILGAVEIPAHFLCWLILDTRLGRRLTLSASMTLSGLLLLCILAVPDESQVISTVLAMVGKFLVSFTFGGIYIYTSELFPTLLRNAVLGSCSTSGRASAIVSPFIAQLGRVNNILPPIIFGSVSIVAGLATLSLPDTRNKPLPQTTQEAVNLNRTGKEKYRGEKTTSGEAESCVQQDEKS